jgi:hypothetical protein
MYMQKKYKTIAGLPYRKGYVVVASTNLDLTSYW